MLTGEDGTHARTVVCGRLSLYIPYEILREATAFLELENASFIIFYSKVKSRNCMLGLAFNVRYTLEGVESLSLVGLMVAAHRFRLKDISVEDLVAGILDGSYWAILIECDGTGAAESICGRGYHVLNNYVVGYGLEEVLRSLLSRATRGW